MTPTPLPEVRWNRGWHFPQDMGGKGRMGTDAKPAQHEQAALF